VIDLNESEVMAFDMYFASVCSMQYHPGAGTKKHRALTISECAEVAINMIVERRKLVTCEHVGG